MLDFTKLKDSLLQANLDRGCGVTHVMNNHVQEYLILVQLVLEVLDLLLTISRDYPELVEFLS